MVKALVLAQPNVVAEVAAAGVAVVRLEDVVAAPGARYDPAAAAETALDPDIGAVTPLTCYCCARSCEAREVH